ncbi:Bacteriophage tail protein [Gluconobacter oxydans 621H]|uniref:Bacteriophage tail protein n=1 Tax=Gluconobacter oxydans (strain 621H) TaxID=290633 RepID=Q5FNF9_GLUOX|nr:putative phage tail protein [Gluconobacter oxydans]AAW62088.1 Bacteriophage tail protein [Gluconobacter oxydans 621H]
MGGPVFSADDFRQAVLRLLPKGAIWSRDPSALPSRLAGIWGKTFQRNSQAADNLLTEVFPLTTTELLPEWEETTGLPDPCAGDSPTISQRRGQVVARLTDSGGSSIDYFVAFAETLGFEISIVQHAPARVGMLRAGDPLYSEDWAFAWTVSAPGYTIDYFRADTGAAGEPLAIWGNAVLRCEIESRAPAHTIVLFAQNGQNVIGDFGPDIR